MAALGIRAVEGGDCVWSIVDVEEECPFGCAINGVCSITEKECKTGEIVIPVILGLLGLCCLLSMTCLCCFCKNNVVKTTETRHPKANTTI